MTKEEGYCPVGLYPGHDAATWKDANSMEHVCEVNGCDKHHHPVLNRSKDNYVTLENMVTPMEYLDSGVTSRNVDFSLVGMAGLCEVYDEKEVDVMTFFDDGITCFVDHNSFAVENNFYRENVRIALSTINKVSKIDSRLDLVELEDREGVSIEPKDQEMNLMKEKDFWEAEKLGCEASEKCKKLLERLPEKAQGAGQEKAKGAGQEKAQGAGQDKAWGAGQDGENVHQDKAQGASVGADEGAGIDEVYEEEEVDEEVCEYNSFTENSNLYREVCREQKSQEVNLTAEGDFWEAGL